MVSYLDVSMLGSRGVLRIVMGGGNHLSPLTIELINPTPPKNIILNLNNVCLFFLILLNRRIALSVYIPDTQLIIEYPIVFPHYFYF